MGLLDWFREQDTTKELTADQATTEIGSGGLKERSGVVFEEFLPQLSGGKAKQIYREMEDNDATVSSMLFVLRMFLRSASWQDIPFSDDPRHADDAEFLTGALDDMSHTWSSFIDTLFASELPQGFAPFESVYKIRDGVKDSPGESSQFTDRQIGWRKFALRPPETVAKWLFDAEGGLSGMEQIVEGGRRAQIPVEKMMLFRTTTHKGNPEGRALAADTPIPTPDGWTTIGHLREGDQVYDEQGRIRYVVATQRWSNRPAYKLQFEDGSEIVADANHVWPTATVYERCRVFRWTDRTTEDIAQPRCKNLAVPMARPIDGTERSLLVHPYVLGLWLGDGNSLSSIVTCHVDDLWETVGLVEDAGYEVAKISENGRDGGKGRKFRIGSDCQRQLRALGLIGDKHIPVEYLRAPAPDRLALLQGLMDSDGTVDRNGRSTFTNTNLNLAHGLRELARSLGVSSRMWAQYPDGKKRKQIAWRVAFTPHGFQPFRLQRKQDRVRPDSDRRHTYRHHYIRRVEKLDRSIDTVCIQVDSPSHLYLAGEAMIPTHNSMLRSVYPSYHRKKRIETLEAIAIERDMTGFPVVYVQPDVLDPDGGNSAAKDVYEKLAKDIRRDEQHGAVLPSVYDENGNRLVELQLLASPGRHSIDTSAVIRRISQDMMMTVLADVLLLGHEKIGTQALSVSKTDLLMTALQTWLDDVGDVFNRHEIPRLYRLNGRTDNELPRRVPEPVRKPDVEALTESLFRLAQSGAPLWPSEELAEWVQERTGIPITAEDELEDLSTG